MYRGASLACFEISLPFLEAKMAISKKGNGQWRNGERGMGNGERGISKIGNI